jgi:hypothetical protein
MKIMEIDKFKSGHLHEQKNYDKSKTHINVFSSIIDNE